MCDTLNTIREYFSDEESKKYSRGRGIDSSTWSRFLDNLKPVSVEIKSILDRVQKEKLQEENTKLRDVLEEIDTHTAQLSVDFDWTNCSGRLNQYWNEFKEDISKQKSTLDTEIENIVEANEIEKYKRENTKLCHALEKILYWQKNLHRRMSFENSDEGKVRNAKWGAFNDHVRTLIETNTL